MVLGAAEAFTTEQFADLYDVHVLGTQRVNRAALPKMRGQSVTDPWWAIWASAWPRSSLRTPM
ncbi:hypothetical protein ACIRD8_14405 [Streptomyces sp. NPDC102451]|uniref:hypothetical protein n=1 Tax=Streptomyces sp. NPDC102451 TaxID=3366177 RepID=UPI0037F9D317